MTESDASGAVSSIMASDAGGWDYEFIAEFGNGGYATASPSLSEVEVRGNKAADGLVMSMGGQTDPGMCLGAESSPPASFISWG